LLLLLLGLLLLGLLLLGLLQHCGYLRLTHSFPPFGGPTHW
jgi:hypothetical protein